MIRLTIAISLLTLAPAACFADALSDLTRAVEKFRGVGHEDVGSYRVELNIPEEGEEPVPLEEIWRAPSDVVLRAARAGTPIAIVRSLALYLEPLYVARTSLLDADLGAHVDRLRESTTVRSEELGARTRIVVQFPDDPAVVDLETLRDVARLAADVDHHGRVHQLEILLREEKAPLILVCEFAPDGDRPQPDLAVWTLPGGDRVEILTTFRDQDGRSLPASRLVRFPSRYDPGEREEILVEYGTYAINPEIAPELLSDPGSFRYDTNGLVSD